jgi:cytochrome c biogenesis protein CcmG/thiol:disulfide interchange protein DsbE
MDDSNAPVRKFYAKFNMNYPVGVGSAKLADQFGGILGLPLTFLIDRDGTIVRQYSGNSDPDKMGEDIKVLLQPGPKRN